MEIIYHYPPELFTLLVDVIPLLCKSKKDTIIFLRGAGVSNDLLEDLNKRVTHDRENINKYEIVRIALTRLNEKGEKSLRERREILKRVCEFESFENCWQNDQFKAKGLVSEIRRIINVKDSFTRMKQERDKEKEKHREKHERKIRAIQEKKEAILSVKQKFYSLFATELTPQKRGTLLEEVLNSLFEIYGISIRESFTLIKEEGEGVAEQVDGVVEIDGNLYLVEMKWTTDPIDVNPVSRHLVRIYHRGQSRGIFISAAEYTKAAISVCKEALQKTVISLCTLEEIVNVLEKESDLISFLKEKINTAVIDKTPFKKIIK
ncbi:MAG TPA: restriction endonuclease [Alphaproteobacteria bacterium]|nr:restriction endonuclease [Alphaproteobacteria bacterium]